MKNTVRVNRTIAIVMIVTALFVACFGTMTAFAAETVKAVGTIEEQNAEFVREALAKALEAKGAVETEPVVEGATGTVETSSNEVTFVAEEAEAEATDTKVEFAANSMSFEAVEEELGDATIAQTADDTASATAVTTVNSTTTETPDDEMEVSFGATEANYTVAKTNAKYIGKAGGEAKAFTVIGDNTFYNNLQNAINGGNIVCWPSCDMTRGVKYFAGHNPGAMSHMAGLKVGSVVRLSNGEAYQDYKIVEIKAAVAGQGFDSVKFKTAGTDAWTLLSRGTQNAVIVQYCIDGVSTLHYGVAL